MPKKARNEVVVGLTVLIILILTVYIAVILGDWNSLFASRQSITVRLPYQVGLKGLIKGSPVFLGGAKIGKITDSGITSIKPDRQPDEPITVFFTMEVSARYPLRDDCVLTADSNILGGQVSLVISDLGKTGSLLKDGQSVTLHLEGGLTDVMETIRHELNADSPDSLLSKIKTEFDRDNSRAFLGLILATATNLKTITEKIRQQVEIGEDKQTLMAKLHQIFERLNDITLKLDQQFSSQNKDGTMAKLNLALDTLNNSLTQIDQLVTSNKSDVTDTIASLKKTTQRIEKDIPDILAALKSTLEKADIAMADAKEAMAHLKQAAQSARDTLQVNRQTIDAIVQNLHAGSSNLKLASREIRLAPWKLVYQPNKGEIHLQSVVDAAGRFVQAAERLDSTTLRLNAVLNSAGDTVTDTLGVDKKRIESILAELETTFSQFKLAEEKFWNELK